MLTKAEVPEQLITKSQPVITRKYLKANLVQQFCSINEELKTQKTSDLPNVTQKYGKVTSYMPLQNEMTVLLRDYFNSPF